MINESDIEIISDLLYSELFELGFEEFHSSESILRKRPYYEVIIFKPGIIRVQVAIEHRIYNKMSYKNTILNRISQIINRLSPFGYKLLKRNDLSNWVIQLEIIKKNDTRNESKENDWSYKELDGEEYDNWLENHDEIDYDEDDISEILSDVIDGEYDNHDEHVYLHKGTIFQIFHYPDDWYLINIDRFMHSIELRRFTPEQESTNEFFLCDGIEGLKKFLEIEVKYKLNESVNSDWQFKEISDGDVIKWYESHKLDIFNEKEIDIINQKVISIFNQLSKKDAENYGHKLINIQTLYGKYGLYPTSLYKYSKQHYIDMKLTTLTYQMGPRDYSSVEMCINKFEDDWYLLSFEGVPDNSVSKNFLCDGIDGINNINFDMIGYKFYSEEKMKSIIQKQNESNSDWIIKEVGSNEFQDWIENRKVSMIKYKELDEINYEINKIFSFCDEISEANLFGYKDQSISYHMKIFSNDKTKRPAKFDRMVLHTFELFIEKYEDDWYSIELIRNNTEPNRELKYWICDTIEGIKNLNYDGKRLVV